jgi:hypothetical protein
MDYRKDLEGSGSGLTKILSQILLGSIEKNYKIFQ